ncbi:MAG: T9SS C-terminal target domain-containing protein [Bacteroidetes bacterium]|nr:MAG: T9SS C-terminal target domain-containing protein [Bacteroidota bacterium]
MTKKIILLLWIAIAGNVSTWAQEILRPLAGNPAKMQYRDSIFTKTGAASALTLPFKEDFSYPGPYPDSKLWEDNYVFINTGFAVHPKSFGTATFDALNAYGEIYPQAEENSFQFSADFLTSKPIRLDSVFDGQPFALEPSDSILLTFYYQPQGHGSAPRQRDSLVVEFLHTPGYYTTDPEDPDEEIWVDDLWVSKWRAEGETLESFLQNNDSIFFKRVALFIDDEVFLRNDFQFRFRNYASFPLTKTPDNFAGNTSIWNVDYITLDYGRSVADSFYYDIAFAAPAQSILRDLQAMPWSHYIANPDIRHRARFNVAISNLDNITLNYSYRYFITNEAGSVVRNYNGGTRNIAPFHIGGYQSFEEHANPILVPNPLGSGALQPAPSRLFKINHVIRQGDTGDSWTRNDTIVFRQVFDNYFAFDDGSPENGYGLAGFNAKGAVRFILGHSDTLEAVQFYFNPTLRNQSVRPIILKVWKNLDPEIVLYESDPISVEFGEGLNQFVTFPLDPPIAVSDTIYVGWQQQSNFFLNIGYDLNSNASNHIFFNSHGQWLPTIYEGALMIRPIFGPQTITHIPPEPLTIKTKVFPNPVRHNTLNIELPHNMTGDYEIRVFDASGRLVGNFANQNSINVSSLVNGMYFLQITTREGIIAEPSRFIIAR